MMNRRIVASVIFLMCCTLFLIPGCEKKQEQVAEKAQEGWVSLFNGKDLTGWIVMGEKKDGFIVEDGAIKWNGRGGWWLRSEKEYGNFILDLEYKVDPGANSGIFIRCAEEGDPPYTGFEIQVLDSYGQEAGLHTAGSIYDVIAPSKEMSKPAGEWNQVTITCNGSLVDVAMNGEKIITSDFSKLTDPIGKFSTPYAELPLKGYIGFQDHGNPVYYRNIRIKELPE
ncbi:DUF1080 domain-containing protein [candidate division KSB1 bacterium]|nr:DUF1080 domain-containing protein [candidate division KSB1 bacterium]